MLWLSREESMVTATMMHERAAELGVILGEAVSEAPLEELVYATTGERTTPAIA